MAHDRRTLPWRSPARNLCALGVILSKQMTRKKGYDSELGGDLGDFSEFSDGIADLRQILNRIEMVVSVPRHLGSRILILYPVPLFKSAASGPALGPPTAKTRGVGSTTHWQGVRAAGMDGGGNTELLGDINVTAPRATSDITRAANQGFKAMVAGLAMVFVDRHMEESSHASGSVWMDQPEYYPSGRSKYTLIGLATLNSPSWYSGPVKTACQCWLDRVNSLHNEMLSQPSRGVPM